MFWLLLKAAGEIRVSAFGEEISHSALSPAWAEELGVQEGLESGGCAGFQQPWEGRETSGCQNWESGGGKSICQKRERWAGGWNGSC